ncbi:MAG: hypothetical protein ACRD1Y_09210 [Terriglobales bacterium]
MLKPFVASATARQVRRSTRRGAAQCQSRTPALPAPLPRAIKEPVFHRPSRRAILESSLKEAVDPDGNIRERGAGVDRTGRPTESFIKVLIARAEGGGLLVGDLPQWAEKVKRAGDAAAHPASLQDLEREWQPKIRELIKATRRIVESLYRLSR